MGEYNGVKSSGRINRWMLVYKCILLYLAALGNIKQFWDILGFTGKIFGLLGYQFPSQNSPCSKVEVILVYYINLYSKTKVTQT